ncbi:hypothetical protein Pla52o_35360 [Novipirellula galeiformis]|uniref:Uncharacterized protein n=1 Tax=Novipirellula galeiformis TaxID=2528004 RepID=A0A5C6CD40_9BACT|nr:hypothetical protein [Novipirellula galeiformis]TWU22480.1 hypothetical protein Pla52o_35360 [Novipirellula galeiformis]
MSNRRTFLKSTGLLGIFGCLPTVEVREGVSMDLMQQCCNPEQHRWDMASPFVEKGNATATDGRICLRVFESMGIADEDKPLRIPPTDNAFQQLWNPVTSWSELPRANYESRKDVACTECIGRGYHGVLTECETCCGLGEIRTGRVDEWSEIIYADCKDCCSGFRSDRKCKRCNGNPYSRSGHGGIMRMNDDLVIQSGFHNLIAKLPDVRWAMSKGFGDDPMRLQANRGKAMLFTFQGGQGMCMGWTGQ